MIAPSEILVPAAPETAPHQAPTTSVSVIIVSFNTRDLTLDCLRTVCGQERVDQTAPFPSPIVEVLVVDNGSIDGSVDAIRHAFPNVTVIASPSNSGFGAANNLAMAQACGEYLLLLNSDAFLTPGALERLVRYLEQHPQVAAVGPRLLNSDGSLQPSCFPWPSPARAWLENLWLSAAFPHHPQIGDYRHWAHDHERIVDFVIGACLLVRRRVVETVGGFDEGYFMYSEEADWEKRLHDAGWPVGFCPAAEVTHLGGASGANDRARINRHFFDSVDRYARKHHGLVGLISLRAAMVVGCSLRAFLWALVWLFRPRDRERAASKVRLHLWLVWRQATHRPVPVSAASASAQ